MSAKEFILASQTIDESGPGSILVDFEAVLDFIGNGIRSSGKHHLFPMSRLLELDERMTKPLRPQLQRPQQRSFPHLSGLYLLLRATQLGVIEGQGSKGQIKIDPAMYEQWLRLTATERYFNLLEAWLCRSSPAVLGFGNEGERGCAGLRVRDMWGSLPEAGRDLSYDINVFLLGSWRFCTLALLELFGLVTVQQKQANKGESWCITSVHRTAFGEKLLEIVFEDMRKLFNPVDRNADFGFWQPLLQPHFPQWENNLTIGAPEFRDGDYFFKVSLGEPWRRIAIPAKAELDDLAQCIIDAFDFDGTHLYSFELTGRDGRRLRIDHPCQEAEMSTDKMMVGDLPFNECQTMKFNYDFGADWRFDVELEKVTPRTKKLRRPMVVESKGQAPPEYDFPDDDW